MVSISFTPLGLVISLYLILMSLCMGCNSSFMWGLGMVLVMLWVWLLEDYIQEGVLDLSLKTYSAIKMGVMMFIFSEFMFFLGMLVSGLFMVGDMWQEGWVKVDFNMTPLLISVVLLASGVTLTYFHTQTLTGEGGKVGVLLTVLLGFIFLNIQYLEWEENSFSLMTGFSGNLFYMMTGFHGLHVLTGTFMNIYLLCMLYMMVTSALFLAKMEGVIWYWHFVDVVWLFVYLGLYWYCI